MNQDEVMSGIPYPKPTILPQLLAHGLELSLLADGRIRVTGLISETDRDLIRRHRDMLVGELVQAGRYVLGTLDAIYGINGINGNEPTNKLPAAKPSNGERLG